MPVHDVAAESTRLEQLTHLVEQLNALRGQLETARESLGAITGSAGYGSWHSRSLETTLPDGHLELVHLLAGHDEAGQAAALRDRLREDFQLEIEASRGFSGTVANIHNNRVRGSQGLEAVARTAYQEAARDLGVVAGLSKGIDRASTLKESMDLQNRLLAQNAKSVLAAVRMIAAAEVAAARRAQMDAERSLRLRHLARPRFRNPELPDR